MIISNQKLLVSLSYYLENTEKPRAWVNFVNGSIAGLAAVFVAYPLEISRTRMSLRGNMSNLRMVSILGQTIKHEGIFKGIYKGASVGLMGIIVYKGIGFATFEYLASNENLPNNPYLKYFFSGAGGGLLGQVGKFVLI